LNTSVASFIVVSLIEITYNEVDTFEYFLLEFVHWMLRKNIRMRKEFLLRRAIEEKSQVTVEKRKKMKECLEEGKTIPTEFKAGAKDLHYRKKMDLDHDKPEQELASFGQAGLDDEYANLGVEDPKVIITTSRDPSSRLTQFMKEMRILIPNSQRVNRGSYVVKDLIELGRKNDVTDLIILHEHRGEPDGMIVCHLPYGPTAYFGLSKVVLRHDLPEKPPNMRESAPHLIFQGFTSKMGHRVSTILKALFPVSSQTSDRVVTFANSGNDMIHFRHHYFNELKAEHRKSKSTDEAVNDVELSEAGPRFRMRCYKIELGTLEMPSVKAEWTLKPYFRSQKALLT
jgi:U3 small nucleolar ribonucleoprotein protein IMP4